MSSSNNISNNPNSSGSRIQTGVTSHVGGYRYTYSEPLQPQKELQQRVTAISIPSIPSQDVARSDLPPKPTQSGRYSSWESESEKQALSSQPVPQASDQPSPIQMVSTLILVALANNLPKSSSAGGYSTGAKSEKQGPSRQTISKAADQPSTSASSSSQSKRYCQPHEVLGARRESGPKPQATVAYIPLGTSERPELIGPPLSHSDLETFLAADSRGDKKYQGICLIKEVNHIALTLETTNLLLNMNEISHCFFLRPSTADHYFVAVLKDDKGNGQERGQIFLDATKNLWMVTDEAAYPLSAFNNHFPQELLSRRDFLYSFAENCGVSTTEAIQENRQEVAVAILKTLPFWCTSDRWDAEKTLAGEDKGGFLIRPMASNEHALNSNPHFVLSYVAEEGDPSWIDHLSFSINRKGFIEDSEREFHALVSDKLKECILDLKDCKISYEKYLSLSREIAKSGAGFLDILTLRGFLTSPLIFGSPI